MIPLGPYAAWIKVGLFAAVCAGMYVYGGSNAKARCERNALARENKALVQAVAERDKAIADRNAAQRKADELAKLPPKVIERVHQNPANCDIPKPVADELRKQVAEINAAIRAGSVRGNPGAAR